MPAKPSNPDGNQGVSVALPVYTPRPHRMSKRRFTVLIAVQVIIILHIVLWLFGRHFGWFGGETLSPIEPSDGMELVKYGVINAGAIFFAVTLLATLLLGCGDGPALRRLNFGRTAVVTGDFDTVEQLAHAEVRYSPATISCQIAGLVSTRPRVLHVRVAGGVPTCHCALAAA